jgi:UDP-N-acetylglucosamine 3-dehydrogenase
MKNKKIPIIVVGGGNMGKNHIRLLSASPRFELVAIVDPAQPSKQPESVPVFKSLADLDASGTSYTAAVVAAPTNEHFPIGCELVKRKKHILMEKPLCTTIEQIDKIIEQAEQAGVILAVGHVERYNPAIRKLAEILEAGWIGEPIHVSATRVGGYPRTVKPGDNVLIDLAVHDIDVVRSLFGALRVEAGIVHDTVQDAIPDTAEILLRGEAGISVSIHVNWITPTKIRQLTVTGTRGVCVVDYMLQTCVLHGGNLLGVTPDEKVDFESLVKQYQNSDQICFGVEKGEPLAVELNTFADTLNGEETDICRGEDGRSAVALAYAAFGEPQSCEGSFL